MNLRASKPILLLLALVVSLTSYAADFEFRVLAKKGHSQYILGRGQQQMIKIGTTLSLEGELIVTQGAYVGLVHKSGKTI